MFCSVLLVCRLTLSPFDTDCCCTDYWSGAILLVLRYLLFSARMNTDWSYIWEGVCIIAISISIMGYDTCTIPRLYNI